MKTVLKASLIVLGAIVGIYMAIVALAIAYKPFRYYMEDLTAEYKEDAQEAHMIEMGASEKHAAHMKDIARLIRKQFKYDVVIVRDELRK